MESGIGIVAIVFAGAVVAAAVMVLMNIKKSHRKQEKSVIVQKSGIPVGMEEAYHNGTDPCAAGKPVMYTLHTCRHCVHLKNFLASRGIEILSVFVDDFSDPARREILTKMREFNPRASFPTLVLPDGRSVVGFRQDAVKQLFQLD